MPQEALKKSIQELQIELEQLHFENITTKQDVSDSLVKLEEKLREESFMSGDEYLIEQVKESLEDFEGEHPKITEVMGKISDLLSKIGI